MKLFLQFIFSLFFSIAIGIHIYYVIHPDHKPLWWHAIYFATYGICWAMMFSKNKKRSAIYLLMSIFPFVTHLYYGMQHVKKLDGIFWVCVLVCVLLPAGFFLMKKEII